MRLLRWDDFLRQPVVKGRVATLPTSGQVEGDIYIFTGAGANQNRLARWWATGATTAIWEYMPPRLGWRVQVATRRRRAARSRRMSIPARRGSSWWAVCRTRRATESRMPAKAAPGRSWGRPRNRRSTFCRS
ncbi:DUF2793 domain-containing protein [Pseudomonas aeruginosa]|nr:DUF2793 domain-containing protein [Pseudomonas aeruginosa]